MKIGTRPYSHTSKPKHPISETHRIIGYFYRFPQVRKSARINSRKKPDPSELSNEFQATLLPPHEPEEITALMRPIKRGFGKNSRRDLQSPPSPAFRADEAVR